MTHWVRCASCNHSWWCHDTDEPGLCENCDSYYPLILRCDSCPVTGIEHARATSPAGRLLEQVLELDADTKRFKIDWGEVSAEQAFGLRVLDQERSKWEREDMERRKQDWEIDQRIRQRAGG